MSQDFAAPAATAGATTPAQPAYPLFTRMAAEAFGTFILVLGIVGTWTFNLQLNQGSIVPVALAAGIMLMAAVASVGHVSGGHFNPAVTFGMALAGRTSWRNVLPYWLAQFFGAGVSALVLWSIVPAGFPGLIGLDGKGAFLGQTANGFGEHSPLSRLAQGQTEFSMVAALLVEVIIAAIFVGVIFGSRDERSRVPYPPVVVGLTLSALHIISWPVTNTGLNPARSFASALFAGDTTIWQQFVLFFLAPLAGAALAALFYRAFAPVTVVDGDEALDELEETYGVEPAGDEDVEPSTAAATAPATASTEATTQPSATEPVVEASPEKTEPAAEPESLPAPEGSQEPGEPKA
ncbi:MIP family channel protein [Xylanimonas oleitrophica]|uniref:MIP family channel protein n=1 Tax=Xylanimonas oleitrophica TaxID=2607479 RepID=A0A2W5XWK8_9MICO|nr:aquaporin [Xylanimonas oleitrophica]PZR54958.1 MIP family channel protein [Xylanimonas oleitrophica]